MISRRRYSREFKEKIGRELSLGQSTLAEVCKREGVSIPTLTKWRNQFGFGEDVIHSENKEINDLRKKISIYESALGEMALENHLLKKMHLFAGELKRKKDLSENTSPISMELKKVVGGSK